MERLTSNAGIATHMIPLYHQAIRSQRKAADSSELLKPELVLIYMVDQLLQDACICVSKGGLEGLITLFDSGVANGPAIHLDTIYDDPCFYQEVGMQMGIKTKNKLRMGVTDFASNSKPIAAILNSRGFDKHDEDALRILCGKVSRALRQKVLELSPLRYMIGMSNIADKANDMLLIDIKGCELAMHSKDPPSPRTWHLHRSVTSGVKSRRTTSPESVPQSSCEQVCELKDLRRWDFDPFSVRDANLKTYAELIFRDFDLLDKFDIDIKKLRNLITSAHALYHADNPFHNFQHGFSVLHITYLTLRSGPAAYLTSLDILGVLVAALCHDLDHPGNNNAFEVATMSELALAHSNDSVLENHHSCMTHQLLNASESDICENMCAHDRAEVLAMVTDIIMATDMSVHFGHVKRLEMSSTCSPLFDSDDSNSRRALLEHIVHAADISGQALSPELSRTWGDRCIAEFRNQCEKEKELLLPVTSFMDGLEDELQRMKLQHGFVGNIVIPLWRALSNCFPSLSHMTAQAQANHDYYARRIHILLDTWVVEASQKD